jgi:hypothetical protein
MRDQRGLHVGVGATGGVASHSNRRNLINNLQNPPSSG